MRDGDMLSDKTATRGGGTRVEQNYQKRSLQHDRNTEIGRLGEVGGGYDTATVFMECK